MIDTDGDGSAGPPSAAGLPHPSPVLGRVVIPGTNPLSAVASSKPAHPFAENEKGWGTWLLEG
jgi:hypothetical protein